MAHRSPRPPLEIQRRPPTFFQGPCVLETARFSILLYRHTPARLSCPEESLRCELRPAAFLSVDRPAGSDPRSQAFCRLGGTIEARAEHRTRPWPQCFSTPTHQQSVHFFLERILPLQ